MQWVERPRADAAVLARAGWPEFSGLLMRVNPTQEKVLAIAALMRRRKHALFGAHARNAHVPGDARTTEDIDLLVPDAAAARRAGKAIVEVVPGVRTRATPFGVVQVLDRRLDVKIADLVPADEPITMAALATARPRAVPGMGRLRVPPREILIAMKLDSATDPRRKPKRAAQDQVDAMYMLDEGPLDEPALEVALSMLPPRARRLYAKLRRGWRP